MLRQTADDPLELGVLRLIHIIGVQDRAGERQPRRQLARSAGIDLDRLVGPVKQPPKDTQGGEKTPARPLSLPDESVDTPGPDGSVPGAEVRP